MKMRRTIIASLLTATTILLALPVLALPAQADDAAVSGAARKGPICDATAGTGQSHGMLTISTHGPTDADPDRYEVSVNGNLRKMGKRSLWGVYLRVVGGDTTFIGYAWAGQKGKASLTDVYALSSGSYQLQVLLSKGNSQTSVDGCPATGPSSIKTDVLDLNVG